MKKHRMIVALCAAGLAALPLKAGHDQKSGDEGREGPPRMMAELNLTSDQKEKLKALHQEMKAGRDASLAKTKAVRDKIREEFLKDSPSQATLDSYADELAQIEKEVNKTRFGHFLKIKGILTKEQFTKLLDRPWEGGGAWGGPGGDGKRSGFKGHGPRDKGEQGEDDDGK